MKIAILGVQGSGKSTQAHRIADHFGFPAVSVGGILRHGIEQNDPFVTDFYPREALDAGLLAPDSLVKAVVERELSHYTQFVLEGFPRTADQADFILERIGLDCVVEIEIPESEVISRLSVRGRSDDHESGIHARVTAYFSNSEPISRRFESEGIFRRIDGTGTVDEVTSRILAVLKSSEA